MSLLAFWVKLSLRKEFISLLVMDVAVLSHDTLQIMWYWDVAKLQLVLAHGMQFVHHCLEDSSGMIA